MDSGWCDFCLAVQDMQHSLGFYMDLGFKSIQSENNRGGQPKQEAATVQHEEYTGRTTAGFRNCDVPAVSRMQEDKGIILISDVRIGRSRSTR